MRQEFLSVKDLVSSAPATVPTVNALKLGSHLLQVIVADLSAG